MASRQQPLAGGLNMAAAGAGDGGACCACSPPLAAVEAVAADWMLEFACSCLCRHFREENEAEFRRWRDVAQALINGFSKIPTHQKKRVYLCQLLTRIAKGRSLELQFENGQRISPLESALSFWTLLESEEIKLEKLHEDIRRLIQIQIVAVHVENRYFKEAAEVLERLFTDSESDKPLRVKLSTVIKNKDPYVPLLQNLSYSLLISKIKSYVELFMKENETNFLIQEATNHVESKGLGATALQKTSVNVNENYKSNLETKQRLVKEQEQITDQSPGDITKPTTRLHSRQKHTAGRVLQSLNNLQNVGECGVPLACGRRRQKSHPLKLKKLVRHWQLDLSSGLNKWPKANAQPLSDDMADLTFKCNMYNFATRWTYQEDLELKSGVRMFGVGNWTKILVNGNFNNRTSVMLKDRWRTLCRIEQG